MTNVATNSTDCPPSPQLHAFRRALGGLGVTSLAPGSVRLPPPNLYRDPRSAPDVSSDPCMARFGVQAQNKYVVRAIEMVPSPRRVPVLWSCCVRQADSYRMTVCKWCRKGKVPFIWRLAHAGSAFIALIAFIALMSHLRDLLCVSPLWPLWSLMKAYCTCTRSARGPTAHRSPRPVHGSLLCALEPTSSVCFVLPLPFRSSGHVRFECAVLRSPSLLGDGTCT